MVGSGRCSASSFLILVLGLVPALTNSGCCRPRGVLRPPVVPVEEKSIALVADGAGNFQCSSQSLRDQATAAGYPVRVVTYEWSHGYLRLLADQLDRAHARAQGAEMAAAALAYRQRHPDRMLVLVGHSAGAGVVLSALERLPPDCVDRVVLLSPSVSSHYDLRQALQAVRERMDVFCSRDDWVYLGLVTGLLGNADGHPGPSSGRYGFFVRPHPGEEALFAKLHQRFWRPADEGLGNDGGHFGNYQAAFQGKYVLPLLVP